MASRPFIALVDSGIGGLSVLSEIRLLLPDIQVVGLADNAAFPYGDLPEDQVIQRVTAGLAALGAQGRPDLAVIACNTASTIVLDALREKFAFPIVGCVPPVKPAGALPGKRAIGLLATPATVQRAYTDALIKDFAADSQVIRVGAPNLARLAEQAMRGKPIAPSSIRDELGAFFGPDSTCLVDRVVLGCTHYPLLLDQLKAALPADVLWLDSGQAIARRVRHLLADQEPRPDGPAPKLAGTMLFTASRQDLDELGPLLRKNGFHSVSTLALEAAGCQVATVPHPVSA